MLAIAFFISKKWQRLIFIQLGETHLNVLHWGFYLLCLVNKMSCMKYCCKWKLRAKSMLLFLGNLTKNNQTLYEHSWLAIFDGYKNAWAFLFFPCDRRFGEYTYVGFSLIYESSLNLDKSSRTYWTNCPPLGFFKLLWSLSLLLSG